MPDASRATSLYSKNEWTKYISSELVDIEICDVTLRDGEQTPGVAFTREEKIDIARMLDEMGIEIIEAGFPAVSQGEKESIKAITDLGLNAKICCLSRAVKSDIDAVLDCDADMAGIFVGTSDLHLQYKHHKTQDEVVSCAVEALEYAKRHGLIVRYAAEDSTRTSLEFLKRFYKAGEEAGADYVSIADTVGIMTPATMKFLVGEIRKTVKTPVCVHCHDDLGNAVANTIAAAEAGAKQLHTTTNGIGERAGNASLEEVLMNLRLQHGVEKYDLSRIVELSKTVETILRHHPCEEQSRGRRSRFRPRVGHPHRCASGARPDLRAIQPRGRRRKARVHHGQAQRRSSSLLYGAPDGLYVKQSRDEPGTVRDQAAE